MVPKQSDAPASLQLSSQRKRDLLDYFETNSDELDRWRKFNAAYHEDDRKFMRFLIPPGKRVLELGCGHGDLLAALQPSYGVGVDFGARTIARARAVASRSEFRARRCRGPGHAECDRGAVRLYRDRRHHRHVRGYRRHLESGASAVLGIDPDHHLLLFASVGAGAQARRSVCICAASSRRSTTSPPPIFST